MKPKGFRLFRPKYKGRDGILHEAAKWYVELTHANRPRRCPAFTGKRESEKLGELLVKMSADVSINGRLVDADLCKNVPGLPERIRKLLAKWGILEPQQANVGADLDVLLDRWQSSMTAHGSSEAHAAQQRRRVNALCRRAGFKRLRDIDRGRLERALADWRMEAEKPISGTTSNYIGQAVGSLCRWAQRERIINSNPLVGWTPIKVDDRIERDALDPEEQSRLVAETEREDAPIRCGADGKMRGMIYRLSLATGLRAGELRAVVVGDFDLSEDQPVLHLHASGTKNKRGGEQPLPQSIVPMLREHLQGELPAAPAFKLPPVEKLSQMFRADLIAARERWISEGRTSNEKAERERSDFLQDQRHNGKVICFHSLRHSFCRNLKAGGVPLTTAMQLMRHSSPTLTAKRYGVLGVRDLGAAVAALPSIVAPTDEAAKRSGTDNLPVDSGNPEICLASCLAQSGNFQQTSLDSAGRSATVETLQQDPVNIGENAASGQKTAQAAVGFEPTNNGFAIRPLGPLGYAADQAREVSLATRLIYFYRPREGQSRRRGAGLSTGVEPSVARFQCLVSRTLHGCPCRCLKHPSRWPLRSRVC